MEVLLLSLRLFFSLGLLPLKEKTANVFITGVLGVKNSLYEWGLWVRTCPVSGNPCFNQLSLVEMIKTQPTSPSRF